VAEASSVSLAAPGAESPLGAASRALTAEDALAVPAVEFGAPAAARRESGEEEQVSQA